MTTDDDKQSQEPDPWAGLDLGNMDGQDDAGAFEFTELVEQPPSAFEPVVEEPGPQDGMAFPFELTDEQVEESFAGGSPDDVAPVEEAAARQVTGEVSADDGLRDDASSDIPLAVFPPPEVEADGSDILIGTGRSGIIPMAKAEDDPLRDDFPSDGLPPDAFDDADIARELSLAELDGEPLATDAADSGDGLEVSADFGEPVGEPSLEDVSFDAGASGGEFPFADPGHGNDQPDPLEDAGESLREEAASIAFPAAAAAVAATAASPSPAKRKGSGLGQMVGVVLGGLMALPVTYAILIWGFQKDPFKFAKHAPPQLAFLLPEKLQPGVKPTKPSKKTAPSGGAKAGPSLDDVPTGDDVADTAVEPASDAADGETTEPMEPTDLADVATDAVAPVADAAEPASEPATPATEADETVSAVVRPAEPQEPAVSGKAPADDLAVDLAVSTPPMTIEDGLGGVDPLPGLDGLPATAEAGTPTATPAAVPPLDMSGVEAAVERASQAFAALGAVSDPADPARDRLAVAWYKRMAQLGEELARLETAAADSGRPLAESPAVVASLLDQVCESEAARSDLEKLGRMWLSRQKQRADGVALLVTIDSARRVGPYWSTNALVSDGRADGSGRRVAIISRFAPPAEAGERVVVSGVLFDGDTVWAADVRPVDRTASGGGGQE